MKKDKVVYLIFGISLVIIVGLLIFFNLPKEKNSNENSSFDSMKGEPTSVSSTGLIIDSNESIENKTGTETTEIKKHVPLKLGPDDVLVSFRLDDITFETKQKLVLENALSFARKYNITFDLAVIAKTFDEKADPEVFKIYEDNQDVFEIVAHGLTHKNILNSSGQGEFYDITLSTPVTAEVQEEHIKEMKDIFEKHNLTMATKIFIVPWNTGDNNTLYLAERYGYKLIIQAFIPKNNLSSYDYDNGRIIVSKSWIDIAMNETLTNEDILKYVNSLDTMTNKNQTDIQIELHPINFNQIQNSDDLLNELVNNNQYKSKIKFGMISDRFANKQ